MDDDDQFLEVDFDVKYREANEKNMSEAGRILTERSQHRISAVTGLTKRFEKNDFDKVPLLIKELALKFEDMFPYLTVVHKCG